MKEILRTVSGMARAFTTTETAIFMMVSGPMIAELAGAVFSLRMDRS